MLRVSRSSEVLTSPFSFSFSSLSAAFSCFNFSISALSASTSSVVSSVAVSSVVSSATSSAVSSSLSAGLISATTPSLTTIVEPSGITYSPSGLSTSSPTSGSPFSFFSVKVSPVAVSSSRLTTFSSSTMPSATPSERQADFTDFLFIYIDLRLKADFGTMISSINPSDFACSADIDSSLSMISRSRSRSAPVRSTYMSSSRSVHFARSPAMRCKSSLS